MSTTTQVQKIKLNKMTKARYEETTPVATEFYMLTDVLDSSYDELPTADVKYVGQITQYTGTTTSTLTNGYFYKCTAQGTSPETYAWEQVDVQPAGGSSIPTLTWYSVSSAGNTLTIADTSSAQLVKIYKNGLLLQPTEDYSISGTTLTMVTALVVGDKITTEVF